MTSNLPSISARDAAARIAAGATLIDVRDPDEWDDAHVAGASLIPLDEIDSRVGEIPASGDVIVMCRSGRRSGEAQRKLHERGVETTNLDGGIDAWQKAGFDVVKGA